MTCMLAAPAIAHPALVQELLAMRQAQVEVPQHCDHASFFCPLPTLLWAPGTPLNAQLAVSSLDKLACVWCWSVK